MPPSRLPLFPLPVVLLPTMRMPLRIFEPRYHQMLQDCLDRDRVFGLIHHAGDIDERNIPAGTVGCRASIDEVAPPTDGSVNIVVTGGERFSLVSIDQNAAPYLVANVKAFVDVEEPVAQVTALSLRLGELFAEAATEARTLADDGAPAPVLSANPDDVAFAAAALIEMDNDAKQRLLASRSPSARMRELIALLDASLPALQARAAVHRRAKRNGHAPREQV